MLGWRPTSFVPLVQTITRLKLIVLLFALVGITACGGGGSDDSPAPIAAFTATPASGPLPLTVQLDASTSSVSGGATIRWDFGDLDISTNTPSAPGSDVRTTHVFNYADSFAVTLTVTDDRGRVSRSSRTIEVGTRTMPNLSGMSQAQATAALAAIGIPLSGAAPVMSDVVPVGTVVGQTPAAGEHLVQLPSVFINLSTPIVVREVYIRRGTLSPGQWEVPASTVVRGDLNRIAVHGVGSIFEVAQVVARVGGVDTPLLYSNHTDYCIRHTSPCPGYVADVSFAGQPVGELTFEIRARDVVGNEWVRAYTITHDSAPTLSVTQPVNNGAYLGIVPVQASCADDTGCNIDVLVGGVTYASGPALNTTIDLRSFVNSAVSIEFRVQDARNLPGQLFQTALIEDPTRLTVVAQVPGDILDANGTRVLYAIYDATGDWLGIRDLSTGAEERHQAVGRSIWRAVLLPGGAIYVTTAAGSSVRSATLWRQGVVTDLGPIVENSLAVSGAFAIYYSIANSPANVIRLLDATTGTIEDVSLSSESRGSVAADGTVVFSQGAPTHQLYRYRAGVQIQLTTAPTQSHVRPLTDGANTVFRTSLPNQSTYNVALLEGATEIGLASALSYDPQPGADYSIANGWVAFTRPGAQQQRQIYVRSPGPSGTIQQRTQYSTSSLIEALRDNGELMFFNQSRRYFSDGVSLAPISSQNGAAFLLNDVWHVAIRGTLFAVDTSD